MFTLPPLPFAENALAPVISANTLGFHHGKHHKTYVDNLNNLVKGTEYEGATLEAIVQGAAGKPDQAGIFNNAAQVWNHTFYWNCLRAGGGGSPTGKIADLINQGFGSYDSFKKELSQACVSQFQGRRRQHSRSCRLPRCRENGTSRLPPTRRVSRFRRPCARDGT